MMSPWDMCDTELRGLYGILQQNVTWEQSVVLLSFHFLKNCCSYKAEPEYKDLNSSLDLDATPLENSGKAAY